MMTTEVKTKTMNKADEVLKKLGKKVAAELKKGSDLENIVFIPTPFPALNNLMGGGYPRGRHTVVAGPSQVSKTTTALQTIAYQQSIDPDFLAVYIAAEPLDKEWVQKLGVDLERIIIIENPGTFDPDTHKKKDLIPGSMEWYLQRLVDVLGTKMIDLVVVDSIGALVPQQEILKEMNEDTMMLTPKRMGQLFRKAGMFMESGPDSAAIIWIGHVYDVPTTSGISLQQVKGGNAVAYWAHTRILQRRSYAKTDKPQPVSVMCPDGETREISPGWACRIKLEKTKSNDKEGQEIMIPFILGRGLDSTRSTIMSCFSFGLIEQKGAWISSPFIVDEEQTPCKLQGKQAAIDYFMENEVQRQKLFDALNQAQAGEWLDSEKETEPDPMAELE